MQNIFIDFLPPWVETGLQPAFYDKESGTVLQQVARMYAKVNQLVKAFDDLDEATVTTVNDYISRFTELKDYVDNYFDNLDVQEEINNKLDVMVEDGTLQDIIDAYIQVMLDTVHYIFPKDYYTSGYGFGDISIIKAYDKVILVDTGVSEYKNEVEGFLTDNGVSHIDYLLISHYHDDHIGNVINLINDGYITNTTVVYLAPYCNLLTSNASLMSTYYAITGACSSAGITPIQPTEGDKLTINDKFAITFYNYDATYLNDSTQLTLQDYNNASAVLLVEHGSKKVVYTGDVYSEPMERLYNNGSINQVIDIYKINHHGIDSGTLSLYPLERTAPTYAYLPSNTQLLLENNLTRSKYIALLNRIGTKIYCQFNSSENVDFCTTLHTVNALNGTVTKTTTNVRNDRTIYVDCNTLVTDPDGSQAKPYKDLPQAFGDLLEGIGIYSIYLADGTYNFAHSGDDWTNIPEISNLTVKIYGHNGDRSAVRLTEGFRAFNCDIYLNNITVDVTDFTAEAVNINDSKLYCDWCDFVGDSDSGTHYTAIYSERSKIYLKGCNLSYLNKAINAQYSDINLFDVAFSHCTYGIYNSNGSVYTNAVTYTDTTNDIYYNNVTEYSMKPVKLCDDASGSVTFLADITKFNKMIVCSGSGAVYASDVVYAFRGQKFSKGSTYNARSKSGIITIVTDSSDGTKATITAGVSGEGVRGIFASYEVM